VPAYDDGMKWLFFISHRTGRPQLFAEDQTTGELVQLTDRSDLSEWSIHPSHDGRYVYFTAGTSAWRLEMETFQEERLVDFGQVTLREMSMVSSGLGTTALSQCDRWWAIRFNNGNQVCLAIVDTQSGSYNVILRRDEVSHIQFCPDDSNMIFYAGPLTDRLWIVRIDGSDNRRLYQRKSGEWITHESWIPGQREIAFINWPRGVYAVSIDTGEVRSVASFNAWHAIANRQGTLMVADTNFPDIGLQIFCPLDGVGNPITLCYPEATNQGDHWRGPFPYECGPIQVFAPQHTHPHPSFSPDGKRIVFTSDRTGYSQIYEVGLSVELLENSNVSVGVHRKRG